MMIPFSIKTKEVGIINLHQGQIIELAEEKASRFLTEYKIKEVKCKNQEYAQNTKSIVEKVLEMFDGRVTGFNGHLKELFEERAGIMEFDGGLPKKQAEEASTNLILKFIPN
ncbi:hypothetical protein FBQ94_05290 [Candidatus Jettenia sp. AMX1]|nr:hypothetical protein [Candidatus Jettenia sp. AMX1]